MNYEFELIRRAADQSAAAAAAARGHGRKHAPAASDGATKTMISSTTSSRHRPPTDVLSGGDGVGRAAAGRRHAPDTETKTIILSEKRRRTERRAAAWRALLTLLIVHEVANQLISDQQQQTRQPTYSVCQLEAAAATTTTKDCLNLGENFQRADPAGARWPASSKLSVFSAALRIVRPVSADDANLGGATGNATRAQVAPEVGGRRQQQLEATNLSLSSSAGGRAPPSSPPAEPLEQERARGRNGSESVGATDAGGAGGARNQTTAPPSNGLAPAAPTTPGGSTAESITTTTTTTAEIRTTTTTTTTRKPILSSLLSFGWNANDDDGRAPPTPKTTAPPPAQQQQPSNATLNSPRRSNANQHQANLRLAGRVVCNGRCKCLIVEPLGAANQNGEITAANETAAAAALANQTAASRELDKTLAAFYADDALSDDDAEQWSTGSAGNAHLQDSDADLSEQQQQQQQIGPSAGGRRQPADKKFKTAELEQRQSLVAVSKSSSSAASAKQTAGDEFHLPLQHRPADEQPRPLAYSHYNQFYPSARFPFLGQPAAQQQSRPSGGEPESTAAPGGGYPVVYHHHSRLHSRPLAPSAAGKPLQANQIKEILALRSLELANGQLATANSTNEDDSQLTAQAERLLELLDAIERDNVQSLSLRNNDIKFEYLTQLYALLSLPMRQSLFQLDLSHNSLVKLGVTFTGYIEHQMASSIQKSVASGNESSAAATFDDINWWPFNHSNSSNYSSDFHQAEEQQILPNGGGGRLKSFASSGNLANAASKQRLRLHPVLGDGKLFHLVVKRLYSRHIELAADQQPMNGSAVRRADLASFLEQHFNFTTLLHQTTLIRALDLSHNKLKWLINDQFRAMKQVQSIRLNSNRIRFIHQQAFNGLEALKYLNLNSNRIQTIYVEQFQSNFNLMALMLRSNYLAYLRAGSFASLSNLKQLDLSRNKFTILSNNAFVGLESLESLNLSSNQFVHVPSSSLHPMTSLARLDLSNNQLAQLVPGTFFHLTIEELALNDNEQLVVIDRGALWDLPYLRRLNLSSNPMLSSINSQAFVGTQNLHTIEVDDCPSLDASAKQMLENITMAATSRQLRIEQQQQQQQSNQVIEQQPTGNKSTLDEQPTTTTPRPGQLGKQIQQQEKLPIVVQQEQPNYWKYVHSVALLTMLVVALKFVFKFTATRNYLERRRRARRVYQTTSSDLSSSNCSSSSSESIDDDDVMGCAINGNPNSIALCERQPNIHVIGLTSASTMHNVGQSASARRCSSASSATSGSASSHTSDAPEREQDLPSDAQSGALMGDDGCHLLSDSATGVGENNFNNVITQAQQQQPMDETNHFHCPDCSQTNLSQAQPADICQQQHCHEQSIELINESVEQSSGPTNNCCDQQQQQQTAGLHLLPVDQQQTSEIVQQVSDINHAGDSAAPGGGGNSPSTTLEMIHNQLIEAGFDYGHANCLHFYQSIGPALQFADMTANYVNQMDYYS